MSVLMEIMFVSATSLLQQSWKKAKLYILKALSKEQIL